MSGSCHSIPYIETPMLCVQAADDPVAPLCATPVKALQAKERCIVVVTHKGGHLGWISKDAPVSGRPWINPLMVEYFGAVLEW